MHAALHAHRSVTVAARVAIAAVALLLHASSAASQKLTLSVSPSTITFASADPDTVPAIASTPVVALVRVQQNSGSWQLTVQADGDLISGTASISASQVTWTASPAPPFKNGTLSKITAQSMASGTGNVNPATSGSVVFRLANSWNYTAGLYSQTLVFTLSAP